MTFAQKIVGGVTLVMVLTAVLLPDRQTVPVLNAAKNLSVGVEHTAITGQT
jgi:hypothetical protein